MEKDGLAVVSRIKRLFTGGRKPGEARQPGGLPPEKIVWIFGAPRTGSTWLSNMMAEFENQVVWPEPRVGTLFGKFFNQFCHYGKTGQHFIFGAPYKPSWRRSIRNLILDAANVRYGSIGPDRYLIIKEPNGSEGAPVLLDALRESKMVFLIRDPRDVVASLLDAAREDSWNEKLSWPSDQPGGIRASVTRATRVYLQQATGALEAYEKHPKDLKVLIRYEDLREDTYGTMLYMYETLGIEVDRDRLTKIIARHDWEKVPKHKKGEGKFYRKGRPGAWQEDLSDDEVEVIERMAEFFLQSFYPEEAKGSAKP